MAINKEYIQNNNKNIITELSDSDFLSFLYSERERENNLSHYQGWNNWALIGAIIGVIVSGYAIAKENIFAIDYLQITYYISGLWAFFHGYKFIIIFFKRKRGKDSLRFKKLKESISKVDICLILISSLIFFIIFVVARKWQIVTWLWGFVLILYTIVLILCVCVRENIVRAFYDEIFFPNLHITNLFSGLTSGLFALISFKSFTAIPECIFNPNFELAICASSMLILFYFFLKLNFEENRVINEFDKIIDEYLYNGVSKENTFKNIRINRMGYNAIEICRKQLNDIDSSIQIYSDKVNKMNEIIQTFEEGTYSFDDIDKYYDETIQTAKGLSFVLKKNKNLIKMIEQMSKQEPLIINTQEFMQLAQKPYDNIILIDEWITNIQTITNKFHMIIKHYYCYKYGELCFKACEQRHEKLSLICRIQIWKRYILNRIKSNNNGLSDNI